MCEKSSKFDIIAIDYLDTWSSDHFLVRINEGDNCPLYCCQGHMKLVTPDGCYCHINPPCSVCVDNFVLECTECGFSFEKNQLLEELSDEEYKEVMS